MTVEVWDAPMAALLDPESELETIELGDRVAWDFTAMHGATIYHDLADRQRSVVLMMLGQVCDGLRGAHGVTDVTDLLPMGWTPADLLGRDSAT